MTAKVLGDNPFAAEPPGSPPDERPAPPPQDASAPAAPPASEGAAETTAKAPPTGRDKAPDKHNGSRRERGAAGKGRGKPPGAPEPAAARASQPPPAPGDDAPDAPDAQDPPEPPPPLGAEALPHPGAEHPPPPQYGRTLDHEVRADAERRGLVDEFRLVERWVRERIQPELQSGERRRLPLEFLWRRWRDVAMRDRSDFVDEFGRDPMYAAKVEPLLEFLYKRYFRVELGGVDHIPHVGRALIVANHSGTLPYDGAMIMYAVRREHPSHREVRPLVEDFVFHFPYLGTFINRIGGVRACQENAERLLRQDQLVAVFPEGIKGIGKLYRERYQLQRFGRGGFIKLALRTDAPIIPAAVVGAEEIHPMVTKVTWLAKSVGIPYIPVTPTFPFLGPVGLVPLPTKWYLEFGEPLYFNSEYGPAGAEDRILVNRLSEQVRSRIQEMVDERLAHRRSVLFG